MSKGIILSGGTGSRIFPLTQVVNKQLLPVYDKPMIYYPLSTLMLAGIREILIISGPKDIPAFRNLLGDGSHLGINIKYKQQIKPEGIAQAFLLGEEFIDSDSVALILGDNLFHGNDLINTLMRTEKIKKGATVFAYRVSNPEDYGIVQINKNGKIINIVEKPKKPISNLALTGLYFYDNSVVKKAKSIKFSKRGELEITDLNKLYLKENKLNLECMGRGIAWFDMGSFDALQEASVYVKSLEKRQGLKIGSPEEIAWRKEWISENDFQKLASKYKHNDYGKDL